METKAMDRRLFLRGLIAAPIVAVALKAAIETKFVPELKAAAVDELATIEGETLEHQLMKEALMERGEVNDVDDNKIFVRAPQKVFNPNSRIWKSVVNEAEGWAAAIAVTHPELNLQSLKRSTGILARAIDRDIKTEEITASTDIIIELPKVLRTWRDSQGRMQAEIAMGLDTVEVRGITQYKVGYIGNHEKYDAHKLAENAAIDEIQIYQPEWKLRDEMVEMRALYTKKENEIEAMQAKRQDEIMAHAINDQMVYHSSKQELAREEKAMRMIESGELTVMPNILSEDVMSDEEWFGTVAAEHVEIATGYLDGWAKTFGKLLWG